MAAFFRALFEGPATGSCSTSSVGIVCDDGFVSSREMSQKAAVRGSAWEKFVASYCVGSGLEKCNCARGSLNCYVAMDIFASAI